MRGKAFLALENHSKACYWFKESLKVDSLCVESFENLIEHNMITAKEGKEIINNITVQDNMEWLKEIYFCKLKDYNNNNDDDKEGKEISVLNRIDKLENKYKIKNNSEVIIIKADYYYYKQKYQEAVDIIKNIIENEPHNSKILTTYISCLVQLKNKQQLFYISHKLIEENNGMAVSWYGVGCYYYLIGNYDTSRRYFSKSTTIDSNFGAAWIGFGHSFAAQGEHDQAMASYRSASRMLSSSHLPHLFIAMELIRVNNFNLAEKYIEQSKSICSDDPLIYNELGVIAYKNKQYQNAVILFKKSIDLVSIENLNEIWEPTLSNLAHSYRKLKLYNEAIKYYLQALTVTPNNSSIYGSLGFTYQLQCNFLLAIEYYHKCLSLKPDDSFIVDCLNQSLLLINYL